MITQQYVNNNGGLFWASQQMKLQLFKFGYLPVNWGYILVTSIINSSQMCYLIQVRIFITILIV